MKDYTLVFIEPTEHEQARHRIIRAFEDAGLTLKRDDDDGLQFCAYKRLDAVTRMLDKCADVFAYIDYCSTEMYTFGV